jgi:hypothetical protein
MHLKQLIGQDVIEPMGHMCIFLPKFHCELNFIEFFWGVIKKFLHDNCDYMFAMLKENMPKALASVQCSIICLLEHCMHCWMNAYRLGLGTTKAQLQVNVIFRKFRPNYIIFWSSEPEL